MRKVLPWLLVAAGATVFVLALRIGRLPGSDTRDGAPPSPPSDGAASAPSGPIVAPPAAVETSEPLNAEARGNPSRQPAADSALDTVERAPAAPAPEEEWRKKYAGASMAEIEQQQSALDKLIIEASGEELERMLSAGEYDVVGKGNVYRGQGWDPEAIQRVRMVAGGGITRAVLPRERFPQLYALKAESVWLGQEARRRTVELAMQEAARRR